MGCYTFKQEAKRMRSHSLSGQLLGFDEETEAQLLALSKKLTAEASKQFDEPMRVVIKTYIMPKGHDVSECIVAEAAAILAELEDREKSDATTH